MVTYTILMKPLSIAEPWQDITGAVIEGKDMKIRKGFSSLSSAIDVGNVSLDIHMASLADATLLHVDRKLVQIRMDGVTVFEGVSYDDSSVDLKERSDHVYTKLKFKPYSAFFGDAVAKEDVALIDKKICDPSDTANSLLHILFAMIIENTEIPALFSGFNVSTTIINTKRLPIVLIEADDNLEDHLTKLLYHNGYSYYMDLYTAVVVEPYKDGRSPSTVVKITDVLKSPAINQAPYIDDEKCVVKLGRVDVYDNDTVYELNRDRYEDTGEATEASFIKSGDYYPLDSDDQPSILDASYESERENDNVELIYTEGRSMVYEARQINPNDSSATIPAYIVVAKAELNTLQADIQLYNNLGVDVSLRNIKIMASKAYYRDWSEEYEDKSSKASKVDDYEGIFMPDADTAKAFIRRYVAEKAAERTRINFKTHVVLQPNTLFTITEFPYQLLVRYVTQTEPGFYEYECVAYAITAPNIGSKIKVVSKRGALDGSTVIPVTQYALGDENGPIEDAIIVADDTYRVADDYMVLGANSSWSTVVPTPGVGEYIWQRVGYYKPPATRPSSWSDPIRLTGIEGESARLLTVLASSTVIPVSSRGMPRIAEIILTAELQNIDMPVGGLVWTTSQPGLVLTAIDAYSVKFDTLDVSVDSLTIQVEADAFTASATIVKLSDGKPAPLNFGGIDYVPTETPSGEALVVGDYFLWSDKDTKAANALAPPNHDELKMGSIYEWDGTKWALSANGDLVFTLIGSIAELPEDMDSSVIGYAIIKKLVTIQAFIDNLKAKNAVVGLGDGTASSGFRFRAMTDSAMDDDYSESGSPKVPVFDVWYHDKVLFKVDIETGNIYFGTNFLYDPISEEIRSSSGAFKIDSDGKLSFTDGTADGLTVNDINVESGQFKGQLDTVTIKTFLGSGTYTTPNNYSGNTMATDMFSGIYCAAGAVPIDSLITADGTLNGKTISKVKFYTPYYTYDRWRDGNWLIGYIYYSATIKNFMVDITCTDGTTYTYRVARRKVNGGPTPGQTQVTYPSYPTFSSSICGSLTEGSLYSYSNPYSITALRIKDPTLEELYIYNLPMTTPSESGRIWKDSSGYLRIV